MKKSKNSCLLLFGLLMTSSVLADVISANQQSFSQKAQETMFKAGPDILDKVVGAVVAMIATGLIKKAIANFTDSDDYLVNAKFSKTLKEDYEKCMQWVSELTAKIQRGEELTEEEQIVFDRARAKLSLLRLAILDGMEKNIDIHNKPLDHGGWLLVNIWSPILKLPNRLVTAVTG